jgi:hypothetical protein
MFSRVHVSFFALLSLVAASGCATETGDAEQDQANAVSASRDAQRVLDVPFYFSVPKAVIDTEIDRSSFTYGTYWNPSKESDALGLRVIAVPQRGTDPASKRAARQDMARQLAKAGVLQDGDVALTFRPELADTMAYPHIQMGTTHASLVYTDGNKSQAFNVDSPLNPSEYNGSFDKTHFIGGTYASGERDEGTDALQILRPHGWDDARRAQLRGWASLAADNAARGAKAVSFQSDYLKPLYAATGESPAVLATELGKALLNGQSMGQGMYCSEFAWHMLALSGCSKDDSSVRDAAPGTAASCIDPVFAPMPFIAGRTGEVGLAEGPLLAIQAANRNELVPRVFAGSNPGKLSSGHRAVAAAVGPFMGPLQGVYNARLQGTTPEQLAPQVAQQLGNTVPPDNYSPTAFLVQAMKPGVRKVDYIATVVFVDGQIAARPMPSGSSIPR